MTPDASLARSRSTYSIWRDKDGNITAIDGPNGPLPPTEETARKILEE